MYSCCIFQDALSVSRSHHILFVQISFNSCCTPQCSEHQGFCSSFFHPIFHQDEKKVRKLNYCTFKGHNQSSPNRLYGYCINNCKRSYVNQSFSIEKRRFLILNCPQNENENSKTLLQFYRTPLSKRCFGYCVKCKRNGNQAPRP